MYLTSWQQNAALILTRRNKNSYDAAQTNILALPENIDELFTVYRGTDQYTEKLVYQETGLIMSDAARKVYFETGDINYAYEVSQKTHNEWIKIWGNETAYVQAHGSFGTELSQSFGMDRTMISVTSDRKVAEYFAGPQGIVIELQIPKSQLIPQTLPGANESEYLIVNGTKNKNMKYQKNDSFFNCNQKFYIIDKTTLDELHEADWFEGVPINNLLINEIDKLFCFVRKHPNFCCAITKIQTKSKKSFWLPLLFYKSLSGWVRVRIEYTVCPYCGWKGQIANPTLPDLYETLENKFDLLQTASQIKSLPCPRCNKNLCRHSIWVETSSNT